MNNCQHCGKQTTNNKFCSRSCRNYYWNPINKEKGIFKQEISPWKGHNWSGKNKDIVCKKCGKSHNNHKTPFGSDFFNEDILRKISERAKLHDRSYMKTKEYKEALSAGLKNSSSIFQRVIHSKEHRDNVSKVQRHIWDTSTEEEKEYRIKKRLEGLFKRPTSLEQKFINEFIVPFNLPYKYTGDGSVLIGFKNPDFIDVDGNKNCVEVRNKKMTLFWNKYSPEEYRDRQVTHYLKWGWKCIVLFDDDLKNKKGVLALLEAKTCGRKIGD